MRVLLFTIVCSLLITAGAAAQETSTMRYEARNDARAEKVFPSLSIQELSLGLIQNEHAVFRYGDQRQIAVVGSLIGSEALLVMAVQPQRLLVKTVTGFGLIEPDASGKIKPREARPAYLSDDFRREIEKAQKEKTIERPASPKK